MDRTVVGAVQKRPDVCLADQASELRRSKDEIDAGPNVERPVALERAPNRVHLEPAAVFLAYDVVQNVRVAVWPHPCGVLNVLVHELAMGSRVLESQHLVRVERLKVAVVLGFHQSTLFEALLDGIVAVDEIDAHVDQPELLALVRAETVGRTVDADHDDVEVELDDHTSALAVELAELVVHVFVVGIATNARGSKDRVAVRLFERNVFFLVRQDPCDALLDTHDGETLLDDPGLVVTWLSHINTHSRVSLLGDGHADKATIAVNIRDTQIDIRSLHLELLEGDHVYVHHVEHLGVVRNQRPGKVVSERFDAIDVEGDKPQRRRRELRRTTVLSSGFSPFTSISGRCSTPDSAQPDFLIGTSKEPTEANVVGRGRNHHKQLRNLRRLVQAIMLPDWANRDSSSQRGLPYRRPKRLASFNKP
ncbi:hypothetical protein OGATHE_001415 [Ogataea polymorpha]|uniref:Uncharacterized protein n=1 Tax=Ogataea polymorpha TaxID=460523 RepID=A0A9P8TFQ3_9ASCO|nr:hypothetical protein OGATHE_001415 [Ogataea polymorpha]